MRYKPRIRTVLLFVNLVILCLPVFGIQALRLYESELIRQTEASLISEGVYVREQYLAELAKASGEPPDDGLVGTGAAAGLAYDPVQPSLDVAQAKVRPTAAEAVPALTPAGPAARAAGATLTSLLRRSQRYTLAGVRVVDANGVVVASSRGELGLSLAPREEVQRALQGKTVSLVRERQPDEPETAVTELPFGSRSGRIRVFLGLPVSRGGRVVGAVVLSRTPLDIQKALYLNRFTLLRFAAGLVLVVLTVSIVTATTISRPIEALIRQTQEVKNDVRRATEPLRSPGSHEVAELSRAVADMARALQERSEYVHTFAQHVSHEFKTPLAAFHGVVELLRDHLDTMSREERSRFLDMLSGNATRLQKLVERLLVLAKADAAVPSRGACELGPVLDSVAGRGRQLGLAVEVGPVPPGTSVRMAAETLDSLLANLLDNAKQHGGPNVRVRLTAGPGPGQGPGASVTVTVSDDGAGISPANRGRVFTPFFTTARDSGGTGLGLSIVRSLVEAHGGQVSLADQAPGTGVAVHVTLPLA